MHISFSFSALLRVTMERGSTTSMFQTNITKELSKCFAFAIRFFFVFSKTYLFLLYYFYFSPVIYLLDMPGNKKKQ